VSHFKERHIYKLRDANYFMYEEQIKELGLTDNEAKIYIILLKYGEMNPSEISQKLSLHRGYVYDALNRMQEKGVANLGIKQNKKYFSATSPDNLIELLKLKIENFRRIIPDLKNITKPDKEVVRSEMYKGMRVYRDLLKDIISSTTKNDEILLIGIDEDIFTKEVEPIYLEQYLNTIKSKRIRERIIIKKGGKRIKKSNLKYKEIDSKHMGNVSQIIYGNKVALFIFGDPHYLIILRNWEIAETYKKQFELMWKIAK